MSERPLLKAPLFRSAAMDGEARNRAVQRAKDGAQTCLKESVLKRMKPPLFTGVQLAGIL